MADEFISLPIEQSPTDYEEIHDASLQASFPGWTPDDGALDTAQRSAYAAMVAQLAELATTMSTRLYLDSGQRLDGLLPVFPVAATGVTTWTASAPVPLPGGSTVGLDIGGGQLAYFQTVDDYDITGASLAGVPVTATVPGTGSNGYTGAAEIVDAPAEITAVTFTDTTGGGTEGETTQQYLDRLTRFRRLRAAIPVRATDFPEWLREFIPTVARAAVLDGYSSTDQGSYTVAGYDPANMATWLGSSIAVTPVDAAGEPLGSADFAAADVLFNGDPATGAVGVRLANYNVEVLNPHYTTIDVTVTVAAWSGFNPDDVQTQVEDALAGMFHPANWGQPSFGETPAWENTPQVKQSDIIATILAVESVKGIVTGPTFRVAAGTLATTTITLPTTATEPMPLTRPGTMTVTVS